MLHICVTCFRMKATSIFPTQSHYGSQEAQGQEGSSQVCEEEDGNKEEELEEKEQEVILQ